MNFEEIKRNWQRQAVNAITTTGEYKSALTDKWAKHQQKVFQTNVCMSLAFLAAMTGIGWVYFSFKDEYHWPFDVSIASAYLLMIVFGLASWRSYAFDKDNFETSSEAYLAYQLKKLNWQRSLITTYVWLYNLLLWLALTMYIWEITNGGTALLRYSALAITTAYILGICLWARHKKQKKQLLAIDNLSADLRELHHKISAD